MSLAWTDIWAWCCGAPVLSVASSSSSSSLNTPPATAPGGRKRLLTRHVPRTRGDARAEGVPGQGERWSGAPHQGAHPRR